MKSGEEKDGQPDQNDLDGEAVLGSQGVFHRGLLFAQRLQTFKTSSERKLRTSRVRRHSSRARIIKLVQLGHDEQGRDFRFEGDVAGDEDDRTVLADRSRKRQRETRDQGRENRGKNDAGESLSQRGP